MRKLAFRKNPFRELSVTLGLMVCVTSMAVVAPTARAQSANASKVTSVHTESLRLPLYPGASEQSFATILYAPSTSPYLKTGSARFVVRSSLDKVKSWYLSAMPAHGYRLQSSNSNGQDGFAEELDFIAKISSGLNVTLDFRTLPNRPKDTAIYYTVTDMTPPPRTKQSLISPSVKKVEIQYIPASTSGTPPVIKRSFTQPSVLNKMVHAINALPVDIRDSLYNTTMYKGGATLRFVDSMGHVTAVKIQMAENRVIVGNTPPLFDIQNNVWQVVSATMKFAPYPPRR